MLGRVLSLALHAGGGLCLHGSAVNIRDRVIAFLAPKGAGKSTLAFALVESGARLVTDDTVAVELSGADPLALPGITGLRLRADSASLLGANRFAARRALDGKHVIEDLPDERLMIDAAPLAAIYLLKSVQSELKTAAARILLAPRQAAMALIAHAKIGSLLGRDEAGLVVDRAVSVAGRVPVYSLTVPRNLDLLEAVARQVAEWHGCPVLAKRA